MKKFIEMDLPEPILHTIANMKYDHPTPIQEKSIPLALAGKDILGSAQTGTGKTAAFSIPLAAHLLKNDSNAALVMTPTRELAKQVQIQIESILGRKSRINTALLIGGDSMHKQLVKLKSKPRVIVGTPGRINDHLRRKSLNLKKTNFLVLDETDRMLDMGFSIQIEEIINFMPQNRQTLLFSATLPKNIISIANKYLNQPERVAVSATSSPATNIKQENIRIGESEKHDKLVSQIDSREGSIIIFVKTKFATQRLADKLSKQGYTSDAINGDLKQSKRDRVINNFRKQKYRILVATDVAARGLDIPHIEHVINYDLPQCAEDYIHRIGRTARAGAEGHALNLISPTDNHKWYAIEKLLNPNAKIEKPKSSQNKKRNFRRKPNNQDSHFNKNKKSKKFFSKKAA